MFVRPLSLEPVSAEQIGLAAIMAMTSSVAQEFQRDHPFSIARVRLELFGKLRDAARTPSTSHAIVLGLSGLSFSSPPHKQQAAWALRKRMSAVRLNGRKLIGFDFERDVVCRGETLGIWQDRLRATAWNDRGELVGMAERIDGFPLPWPAC
jgi:hypothetical protein